MKIVHSAVAPQLHTTNDKGNFLTRSHSIHLVGVAESESKLHLAVSLLCIVQ